MKNILKALTLFSIFPLQAQEHPVTLLEVETLYGSLQIKKPVIQEIAESPSFQRLKGITQYGPRTFLERPQKTYRYTRYAHSWGVYYILQRKGADSLTQLAGLLHDISHTAFSHCTDTFYMGNQHSGAYQDQIHEEFLNNYGLRLILNKYHFSVKDVLLEEGKFPQLKVPHPDLCADRIEYILHAGYLEGDFSKVQVCHILDDLRYENGTWYFNTKKYAKQFAKISVRETLENWGSPLSVIYAELMAEILRYLFSKEENSLKDITLSEKDLQFNLTDDKLWEKLTTSKDPIVQEIMLKIYHAHNYILEDTPENQSKPNRRLFTKFRGVDPFVRTEIGDLKRLTSLSPSYRKYYEEGKERINRGWLIAPLGHYPLS